ncbi:MAG: energy transducer TonB [Rikenellaceae bacterium]|nr:energy transducer TonB [Rikenellaceae bacterium]MCL2691840.1 energy transducer TonB [Rikenellaceae bacterium]
MKTAKFCLIALSAILLCTCASTKHTQTANEKNNDVIFHSVAEMPRFRGGHLNTFRTWVSENARFPKDPIQEHLANNPNYVPNRPVLVADGTVTVLFVVEKDGRLGNIRIINSTNRALDTEVMRVLRSSPRWEPGKQGGEPVRVEFAMSITFQQQ